MQERMASDDIRRFWSRKPLANIGLLLEPSNLLIVDLDNEEAHDEAREKGLPDTLTAQTPGGWHYYYRRPDTMAATRHTNFGESRKIDLLGKGFAVAPPSLHRRGQHYFWRSLLSTPLADAPEWAVTAKGWEGPKGPKVAVKLGLEPLREEVLDEALGYIDPEDYETWLHIGFALKQWEESTMSFGRGFDLWDRWSRRSTKYPGTADLNQKWKSFKRDIVTVGTVIKMAKDAGWGGNVFEERVQKRRNMWKTYLEDLIDNA